MRKTLLDIQPGQICGYHDSNNSINDCKMYASTMCLPLVGQKPLSVGAGALMRLQCCPPFFTPNRPT